MLVVPSPNLLLFNLPLKSLIFLALITSASSLFQASMLLYSGAPTHFMVLLPIAVESVNFEPPLVTELNAEPPPARYTPAGQPWDSAMEVITLYL